MTVILNWWLMAWDMNPAWKGGHGGGEETAAIMGIDPSLVDCDQLRKAIESFRGESEQLPPMYSAVKVGGRKLYDLARAGKTVERTPRRIFISSIEAFLEGFPRVILDVECSKGTYIRSIAHQLGEMTGCPAHLSALRRTASGKFRIGDALDFASVARSGAAEELTGKIIPVTEPAVSL
jgi:tRNA pseudouridine55 synthase